MASGLVPNIVITFRIEDDGSRPFGENRAKSPL